MLVRTSAENVAQRHKDSIKKEMKRRHDAIMAEKKRIKLEAEAKEERKKRRNALREAHRLVKMQECIKDEIFPVAKLSEYQPSVKISDVREYDPDANPGVSVLGGLTAELIYTFSALYDWALANPQLSEFRFGEEAMEKFICELLMGQDFPEGTLVIQTQTNVVETALKKAGGVQQAAVEFAVNLLKDSANIHQCGLKFFMKHQLGMGLNQDAVDEVLHVIAKIGVQQIIPEKEQPAEGTEGYEAIKAAVDAENEANKAKNESLKKL